MVRHYKPTRIKISPTENPTAYAREYYRKFLKGNRRSRYSKRKRGRVKSREN